MLFSLKHQLARLISYPAVLVVAAGGPVPPARACDVGPAFQSQQRTCLECCIRNRGATLLEPPQG